MKHIVLISISTFLFACGSKQTSEQKTNNAPVNETTISLTGEQLKNAQLQIGKLEERNISSIVKANGKIDVPPQNMVSVSMPLGGYLKTTKLLPGMHVGKGEVIATMEDLQYIQLQQEYLIAKSKLVFAEAEYIRQKELNHSKATSDKVFQQSSMDYHTQKIILSSLSEKLKLININPEGLSETNLSKAVNMYSPIDGFVSKVNVNIGKYVNPADILFELVNTSDIHLNIKVFEKDLEKLCIGQKVMAYNNQSDKKHPCEIILISQDVSSERTAEVHCHFLDYDKTLLPGMYMNAEIEIKKNKALTLPEASIVNFESKEYVFIAEKESQFTLTEVKTGSKENGFLEISNGEPFLQKNIVIKGAYTLLMKLKNKSEE